MGFFYYRFNTLIPVAVDKEILEEFRANLSLDIKVDYQGPRVPRQVIPVDKLFRHN